MSLEIQIVTLGQAGVERIASHGLPVVPGAEYLLSIQDPTGAGIILPESLVRTDIRWTVHGTAGVSRNRNHALEQGTADILLVSDDDLIYSADGLQDVIKAFEEHPECDYITFCYDGPDNKQYPAEAFEFKGRCPRGYYLTTFELALRRTSLHKGIRFSTDFGPGAPYYECGEDTVMMINLLRSGLRGRFEPVTIAHHPTLTTGSRAATPGVLRSEGAFHRLLHGPVLGLAYLLRDVPRKHAPFFTSLRYMIQGFFNLNRYVVR